MKFQTCAMSTVYTGLRLVAVLFLLAGLPTFHMYDVGLEPYTAGVNASLTWFYICPCKKKACCPVKN